MARVKPPAPYHIAQALRGLGLTFEQGAGFRHGARLYDRTTGNFKAVGWQVIVRLASGVEVQFALFDHHLPHSYQATLY